MRVTLGYREVSMASTARAIDRLAYVFCIGGFIFGLASPAAAQTASWALAISPVKQAKAADRAKTPCFKHSNEPACEKLVMAPLKQTGAECARGGIGLRWVCAEKTFDASVGYFAWEPAWRLPMNRIAERGCVRRTSRICCGTWCAG